MAFSLPAAITSALRVQFLAFKRFEVMAASTSFYNELE
jgi:hypothetical protein